VAPYATREYPAQDVKERGLGLLLFPEWYSVEAMGKMRFFDDNTRSWWLPATGGSNVPALNELLAPHGVAFGDAVVHGHVTLGPHKLPYASGTFLARAPLGALVYTTQMQNRSVTGGSASTGSNGVAIPSSEFAVLGMLRSGAGRVVAYGDASCLDANHATTNCHDLAGELFTWAAGGDAPEWADGALRALDAPLPTAKLPLPERPPHNLLRHVSHVLGNALGCYPNSEQGFKVRRCVCAA
jgi:membrane-bound transcription factor site-1 protease